jgi:signal transduction histidine kinase/ActR/RegA family two-component response regulator
MQCNGTRTRNGIALDPVFTNNGVGDGNGASVGFNERGQTEALRASQERYRTLFDLGPVAVYCCDAAGVIQQFNRRAAELWGREPTPGDTDERFCGSFKMFRPDGGFMPHEQCPMAEVVSGKLAEVRDAEVLIERPDGSMVTVVVNIRPLMSEQGEVAGAINCFYDITERKRNEEQSREYVARLADADRRKGEFLAMLAHELRNPLATIRAGLQVQRLSGADTQAANSVTDLMERQVEHLVGLVDDLLDVNRIGQGKIQLRRGRVELATIVHAAVETARSLIERMGHELILAEPLEPIWLNADPLRVAQVVGNLLNNASKFTENGGCICLTVALQGEEAEIRVRDNGVGIGADQLPFVFDMFMQAEAPIERSGTGLGIGLALVKNLVEMHGGTVEAHSAGLGHGSEFVVRLPVTHEAAQPQPIAPPHESLATTTARRVLLVDDNRDAAESLAMLLNLSGHDTHIAHDGLEAVEKAAQLSPDIILLDIGLPKIDGFEAARRIREQSQGKRPVIVALTGWAQDADRQKSREAGFNAHIVKPVDPDVLANLLVEFPAVGSIR